MSQSWASGEAFDREDYLARTGGFLQPRPLLAVVPSPLPRELDPPDHA